MNSPRLPFLSWRLRKRGWLRLLLWRAFAWGARAPTTASLRRMR